MSHNPFAPNHNYLWADRRSNIVVSDSPSTRYIGDNRSTSDFSLFHIDGHVLSNQNANKCDYLLIRSTDAQCFFIELKGSDLAHAALQIFETIRQLKHYLNNYKLNARIILTRTPAPALRSSNYLRLKQLIETNGGTLIQRTSQLSEIH